MLEISLLFDIVDVVKRCTFKNNGPVTTLTTFSGFNDANLAIAEVLMNNVMFLVLH